MNKIESLYASNNKLYLLNCLMNLWYMESSSILDYLNEFQGLLDQLSRMCINFDDEVLGLCLLNYSTRVLEDILGSITNSTPIMALFLSR